MVHNMGANWALLLRLCNENLNCSSLFPRIIEISVILKPRLGRNSGSEGSASVDESVEAARLKDLPP
jgi:hypothetical protein